MSAGLATSLSIETALLRYGLDRLSWRAAATTAAGMSVVSMLSMEAVQNIVDYHLMGGVIDLGNPEFWAAAAVSACALQLQSLHVLWACTARSNTQGSLLGRTCFQYG